MGPSSTYLAAFAGVTLLALVLGHRLLRSLFARGERAALGENAALATREVGSLLALFVVGAAVVKGSVRGEDLASDALWCGVFAGLGLVLLEATSLLGQGLVLKSRLAGSLERGNVAAGLAAAGHQLAMGLLTSRAVAGNDLRGVGLSVTFFVLGVVTHQLVVALFRAVTTYDDAEQIDGENAAAAMSYAGMSLGVALVIARALEGDFVDWASAFRGFGTLVACTVGFYPLRQLVVQGLVLGERPTLRGGALDLAIGRDRRLGTAALEAAAYVGAALAILTLA